MWEPLAVDCSVRHLTSPHREESVVTELAAGQHALHLAARLVDDAVEGCASEVDTRV